MPKDAADGTIDLWVLTNAGKLREIKAHKSAVAGLGFDAEGALISAGTEGDETVRHWDASTGDKKGTKKVGALACFTSAISRDGTRLAVTAEGGVDVLDAASGKKIQAVQTSGLVRGIAFRPDGAALAWVVDGLATVWDLTEGRTLASFPLPLMEVTGPGFGAPIEEPRALAFGNDGRTLIFGAVNGAIAFYAVASGRLLASLHLSMDHEVGLVLSPEGRVELLGDVERAASLACARIGPRCVPFAEHSERLQEAGLLARAMRGET